MIGFAGGIGRRALNGVEARHLFFQIGIASGRKRAGIVKESREPAGKEVAIEGQNDVGLFQVVTRFHILPERQLRPSSNVVTVQRLILRSEERRTRKKQTTP